MTIRMRIELDKCRDNLMLTENNLRSTEFEEMLQTFIYDMIIISVAIFNKVISIPTFYTKSQIIIFIQLSIYLLQLHTTEIPTKSPFLCACIKEMWLLTQLLVDKFHESQNQLNSFWSYFNTAMTWLQERKGN